MAISHNLGFPRIGKKRELKFLCERYWRREISQTLFNTEASAIFDNNLQLQIDSGLDQINVGDFSLYDHMLDTSELFGNLPQRALQTNTNSLDRYFLAARGRSADKNTECKASAMTKWFNTNYHYLVPEIAADTVFELNTDKLLTQIDLAKKHSQNIKPVIVGPLSYLWLSRSENKNFNKLELLDQLIPQYIQLLAELKSRSIEWIQIDEPILVLDLPHTWRAAFEASYHKLQAAKCKLMLTTYFGELKENLRLALNLPVAGIHLDCSHGFNEAIKALDLLSSHKVLSLGIIDGRNIWKADLLKTLDALEPIHDKLGQRLWVAPSCSLLHVPVDLDLETNQNDIRLKQEIIPWLAFAKQKLEELQIIKLALNHGRERVASQLIMNQQALNLKDAAAKNKANDSSAVNKIQARDLERKSKFQKRSKLQRSANKLPLFPTTTIGSFPQTPEIRQERQAFKQGKISQSEYDKAIETYIAQAIKQQDELGLDVLVHGEPERNDMVEYFAEYLGGCAISEYGWVQSYGSRCVKPPIIYGDVDRPNPITIRWSKYAQSQSDKPVKGMLTGPITLLQWSFVRNDQPREITAKQIALALRDEVLDLEKQGIQIIQIDEPALREGLPLRKSEQQQYLRWAVEAFKLTQARVKDETQIHTHMCYANFADIMDAIIALDADVITLETSRSRMLTLESFAQFSYPNEIGPGVYDIHSPNLPQEEELIELMEKAANYVPIEHLWLNPDCGLKTRTWEEVRPALKTLVNSARQLRNQYADSTTEMEPQSAVL